MASAASESTLKYLESRSIPEPNSGCILWLQFVDRWGYGIGTRDCVRWPAHRLAWIAERGPIPTGLKVCHKCDVPSCINVDHLFLGTDAENAADRNAKGRQSRGVKHVATWLTDKWRKAIPRGAARINAKLSEPDVLAIRSRTSSQRAIAVEFGVSQRLIGQIKRCERWTHV